MSYIICPNILGELHPMRSGHHDIAIGSSHVSPCVTRSLGVAPECTGAETQSPSPAARWSWVSKRFRKWCSVFASQTCQMSFPLSIHVPKSIIPNPKNSW